MGGADFFFNLQCLSFHIDTIQYNPEGTASFIQAVVKHPSDVSQEDDNDDDEDEDDDAKSGNGRKKKKKKLWD